MLWILLIIVIIVLDQLSKFLIMRNVEMGSLTPVIDKFFYITYHENKGAAWGIFQNGRYFFIVMTPIICLLLAYYMYKVNNKVLRISLTFIIGGAIGNLVDRIIRGSVVDFLDFYIGSYNFPTFNVADMFIVVGTFLLAYYMVFIYKDEQQQIKE